MSSAMERVISITKTKGIGSLEFSVPQKAGVYLLVGGNGAGKTTILTALHRICDGNAFSRTFRSSVESKTVDRYKESCITYRVDANKVSFSKKEKKWAPTPKSNGFVLSEFGFKDSVFIKASDSRLSPREEEIRKGNLEPADEEIKRIMNRLFDTERFSSMQRLRNTFGRGRAFTHFYVMDDGRKGYYSEKSFSTGELAMLRLVERTRDIAPSSLILLDEAELALHPRVQLRLLDYLSQLASDKNLTVFVSTHSPTMIRATDERNILLLESSSSQKGHFSILTPCFPVYALGIIEDMGLSSPDAIFCVEDDMAMHILRELLARYLALDPQAKPQWHRLERRILPIAGWKQTLAFIDNAKSLIFNKSSMLRAVLDHDVFDANEWDAADKKRILQPYVDAHRAFDLGVTPELSIINALDSGDRAVLEQVRSEFHVDYTAFSSIYRYNPKDDKPAIPRRIAKDKLCKLIGEIKSVSRYQEETIKKSLISMLFHLMYTDSQIRRYAKPIFGSLR